MGHFFSCLSRPWPLWRRGAAAMVLLGLASPWAQARAPEVVPGRYIVAFDDERDSDQEVNQLRREQGTRVHGTYRHAFKGAHMTLSSAELQVMKRRKGVKWVEPEMVMRTQQTVSLQSNAPVGLDRISQRTLPLDGVYQYSQTGSGRKVYVVDTGILAGHVELAPRVEAGYSVVNDGLGSTDCNGHGTHVAGTVGGRTVGVAKGVTLVPVRVLDCTGSGTSSTVVAGLDWVAANAPAGSVVNLSLGGGASQAVDGAVLKLLAKGILPVVAAGNENADACLSSPARVPGAVTVGASTATDARASFSNFGSCVDLFAPGTGIVSAWFSANNALATASGTSMASPHVAGAAALLWASQPQLSVSQVHDALKQRASTGLLSAVGAGSPNALLYTLDSAPVSTSGVAVSSLSGSTTKNRRNNTWSWTVTVGVFGVQSRNPVGNATVSAMVSAAGQSVAVRCTTGSTGKCTFPTVAFSTFSVASASVSVSDISGPSLTYDSTSNVVQVLSVSRP